MRIPPRWAAPVTLGLSILGLAVASYLTYDHFAGKVPLSCPENSVINCAKVTTSSQSKLFGAPVALLGLLFFVANIGLMSPPAWRDARLRLLRIADVVLGLGFVLYLVSAELFSIRAICLYCTAVHVITLAIFLVTVFAYALAEEPYPDS